ncbi:MAG: hypothetical protein AAF558_06640 [Verrucomicrobiota bacterium]
MNPNQSQGNPNTESRRGIALLSILFYLAIVSLLVVTFMTMVRLERSASRNYSQSLKAEQFALGSLDYVIQQLRQQITAGSDTQTVNSEIIYTPKTNISVRPAKIGTIPASPNLLQKSLGDNTAFNTAFPTPDYDASLLPTNLASTVSTTTDSWGGRSISLDRWNRPQLATFSQNSETPDWVLLTRSGLQQFTSFASTVTNRSSNNFVIGRFAYTIYDLGGLININSAGFRPSHELDVSDRLDTKASLAWADLTELGLSGGQIEGLVTWRNARNSTSSSQYTSYVETTATESGFARADGDLNSSDNRFVTRQDLIQYAQVNGFTNQLDLLTHFQAHLNLPSHSLGTSAATENPDFSAVRINGTPLQRFPLDRLKLLESINPSITQLSNIAAYFGLAPVSGFSVTKRHWVYNQGSSTEPIKSIDTVIAENRQPNFFEMLYATLENDTLGQDGGNNIAYTSASDSNKFHQIIRIGAAIIDQYDADGYPTIINFTDQSTAAFQHYGIENLPYFSELILKFRAIPNSSTPPTATVEHYLFCELWNPHQGTAPANGPSQIRVLINDSATWRINAVEEIGSNQFNFGLVDTGTFGALPYTSIDIGSVGNYSNPTVINTGNASSSYDLGAPLIFNGWKFTDASDLPQLAQQLVIDDAVFQLQYFTGSEWQTYNTFGGLLFDDGTVLRESGIQNHGPFYFRDDVEEIAPRSPERTVISTLKSDPRTQRFGASASNMTWQSFSPLNTSLAPNGQNLGSNNEQVITESQASFYSGSSGAYPARLWTNTYTGHQAPDRDGVTRPGDGFLTQSTTNNTSNPFHSTGTDYRPIILNREFRSVAELGYAFRDQPWKTLDLFSADSADARLLDAFSLYEQTSGNTRHDLVDLNTPHPEVLAALITKTRLNPNSSATTNTISSSDANTLAQQITNYTENQPFENIADLVNEFDDYSGSSPSLSSSSPSITLLSISKIARESLPRSLASTTSTRTWNLMIDLIAQSGSYPPTASGLADFKIEGERRYWLHLSIDRYTGEVVNRQLEIVYE